MPTATFIHSHLPPLPGFAPVVEIEDEEYILVDHDPYEGTKNEILPKPALKSTDERLAEEQEKEKQLREERRSDSGIFVEPKSRRESKGDEKRVAKLLYGIDKEIVEREDEPFDWRWFGNADIRNKDIYSSFPFSFPSSLPSPFFLSTLTLFQSTTNVVSSSKSSSNLPPKPNTSCLWVATPPTSTPTSVPSIWLVNTLTVDSRRNTTTFHPAKHGQVLNRRIPIILDKRLSLRVL